MTRQAPHALARAQRGFTLVELIIVIVVIGILSAVAIPKLTGMSDEAKKAKNTAVLSALKSAWTIAYAKNSGVVPTAQDVADQMSEPTCPTVGPLTDGKYSLTCGGVVFTYTAGSTPAIVCAVAAECKVPTP
jgi:prepilin-type N-terminal cleavage/methylation domain-containing protein